MEALPPQAASLNFNWMKRVILIHGLKRSGNHAVINWLRPQDRFVFFNNVVPIKPILTGEQDLPEPLPFNAWIRKRLKAKYVNLIVPFYAAAIRTRPLIATLEDHELSFCPFRDPDCAVTNLLIVRDARNIFASRIRKAASMNGIAYPDQMGPLMERVIELWKTHAREFLGTTQTLENKVCISFNQWFSSEPYRRDISRQLGLEFSDAGFSQVSGKGGGSSFNHTEFDGDSRRMQVLNRHDSLEGREKELFDAVFADAELCDLDEQVAAVTGIRG